MSPDQVLANQQTIMANQEESKRNQEQILSLVRGA
jgi:hypothetical protein